MISPEKFTGANWIAGFIPTWIRQEAEYAFTKYDGDNNPLRTALSGGLRDNGLARIELSNYFGNFRTFAEQADDDPAVLALASRQLGKFVNAVRVTNVFMVMEETGLSLEESDAKVMEQLERICRMIEEVPDFSSVDLYEYYYRTVEPAIRSLTELIDAKDPDRFQFASNFLRQQVELFVSFSEKSGVIAEPGPEAAYWRVD